MISQEFYKVGLETADANCLCFGLLQSNSLLPKQIDPISGPEKSNCYCPH